MFISGLRADAINVSPELLDFGNVLMGNSPSMTFTATLDLEQTVTVTAPDHFEVNVTQIAATVGLTQDVVVTFNPPSTGSYNSYVTLTGSVFGTAVVEVQAEAVNNIQGSLSGVITSQYSPYEISGDIWVAEGNTLTIEPGVTLLFMGDYGFDIYGTLHSLGDPDSLIHFRSADEDNIQWEGVFFNNNMNESIIEFTMIEHAGLRQRYWDSFENDETGGNGYHAWGDGIPSGHSWFSCNYSNYRCETHITDHKAYHGEQSLLFKGYDENNSQEKDFGFFTYEILATENASIEFYYNLDITGYHNNWCNASLYIFYDNNTDYTNTQIFQLDDTEYGTDEWTHWTYNFSSFSNYENIIGEYVRIGLMYEDDENDVQWLVDSIAIHNTTIKDVGQAIYINESNINLRNSFITNNRGYGLKIIDSDLDLSHNNIYGNYDEDGNLVASIRIDDNYSDVFMLNSIYNSISNQNINNFSGFNNFNENPVFIDELGHLDPVFSPCVDAGTSNTQDACMPPGLGTVATDIGMYGGLNNCAGDTSDVPDGLPVIVNIEDLPQDQGGYVGIQYDASVYDHQANAITHYSFWRELDTQGRSSIVFSDDPIGPHYSRDSEYWEWIGEMDAQGFLSYGFSAPTLGDSTASSGIFWSKFLVVAHTDNDDIFFVSEADSGYSVDNIAPFAPQAIQVATGQGGISFSWDQVPENSDIAYYEVYKNGEFFTQITETNFMDDVGYGFSSTYTIRGIDENENVGEFSESLEVSNGTLGDITWDGSINVLDVLQMASIIMSSGSESSEGELWASEMNNDGTIDIFDLIQLVDFIMTGGGMARTSSTLSYASVYQQEGSVYLSSSAPVHGLQLRLSEPVESINNLTGMELMHNDQTVLMYSMGESSLSGNKTQLFNIPKGITVESVKVSGPGGQRYEAVIGMVPGEFAVRQNYPNPFNPSTSFQVELPEPSVLQAVVYDAMGREVRLLTDSEYLPGYHQIRWNGLDQGGREVSSGLYFIQINTPSSSRTLKAMLLR
tara:strand:- start:1963 stop:5004 length:3042 start_codon:yes stop_codon:yes gene_type:complete